jgi:IclR family transcriptional regulator, acetate operon repressor
MILEDQSHSSKRVAIFSKYFFILENELKYFCFSMAWNFLMDKMIFHIVKNFIASAGKQTEEARRPMIEIAERRLRGRPRSAAPGQDGGAVQSLERAIAILRTVADADGLSLTEIARIAGLAPSTAYRMLTTLQQNGLAEFEEASQLWFVGVETFRIGSAFLRRRKLAERGRGIIQALMLKTGETANIALAEPDGVVFVTQAETHEPIRAFFRPGTRSPYHASGIGKAVLAFLPEPQLGETLARLDFEVFTAKTRRTASDIAYDLEETRRRGYALDDEERNAGMRCIAAPVFNELRQPIGGVSISGPTVRIDDAFIARAGQDVVEASRALTTAIGGRVPGL